MITIDRIRTKLIQLQENDQLYKAFGSTKHQYKLYPTKTENELAESESKHAIQLQEGYRTFLKEISNGGAGPYLGLKPLESVLYASLNYRNGSDLLNPSIEFLHTQAWNLKFKRDDPEEYAKWEEIHYDNKWINGALRISNFGCGIFLNMVVKGSAYGKIWVDGRASDEGSYPDSYFGNKERIDFLTWYELWLDKALSDVQKRKVIREDREEIIPYKKQPWWKRIFNG